MSLRIALLTTDAREHYKHYERPVPYFGAAPEALIEGFAQLPEVEVHVVSCVRQRMNSPEKLAGNIWYHPVEVPKPGWLMSGYVGCTLAVRRKLRELRPDLVHGQGTERDCAITAVFSGYPNVLTIHGNMAEIARLFGDSLFSYNGLVARLEDFTLPRTTGVFCNSAYTEGLVRPRARKTWRVANPLRARFFEPPAIATSSAAVPLLLNVGVITPRKRQLELLRAARSWAEKGARFHLEFIGDCPAASGYQDAFRREIAEAESAGYARFAGPLAVEALVSRFDQAQALIHFPSEEAFGLVVAEALARNLKFFGARLGGIVDIADGVELAELFAESDWNRLEEGVVRWLRAGAPKPVAAAEEMKRRYAPRVIAARHLEIYREVLNRPS